jgi:hypothetical protein
VGARGRNGRTQNDKCAWMARVIIHARPQNVFGSTRQNAAAPSHDGFSFHMYATQSTSVRRISGRCGTSDKYTIAQTVAGTPKSDLNFRSFPLVRNQEASVILRAQRRTAAAARGMAFGDTKSCKKIRKDAKKSKLDRFVASRLIAHPSRARVSLVASKLGGGTVELWAFQAPRGRGGGQRLGLSKKCKLEDP